MSRPKRVVVLSDTHCGHLTGLTINAGKPRKSDHFTEKSYICALFRWETAEWFKREIAALQPFDALFAIGDLIEGKGEKSGGTELLTSDRIEQAEIAVRIIKYCNAPKNVFVYGTGYHTGKYEDFEQIIAKEVNGEIDGRQSVNVDGVMFNLKHKPAGTSKLQHGRHTGPARDAMDNQLQSLRKNSHPLARILLRGHGHYFTHCGDTRFTSFTLPSLQGWTKFGDRECSGSVDYGFMYFDVKDGDFEWKAKILEPMAAKPQVLTI